MTRLAAAYLALAPNASVLTEYLLQLAEEGVDKEVSLAASSKAVLHSWVIMVSAGVIGESMRAADTEQLVREGEQITGTVNPETVTVTRTINRVSTVTVTVTVTEAPGPGFSWSRVAAWALLGIIVVALVLAIAAKRD